MPLYQTDGPKGDHATDLQGQNKTADTLHMHFNSSSALEVQIILHDDTFLIRSVVTPLVPGCPFQGQKRKSIQRSINCCPSALPEAFLMLFLQ